MQTDPPAQTSVFQAALYAPLVAPLVAIPLTAVVMKIYANGVDLLVKLPFVAIGALVYGYLGMLLICLPIMGVLSRFRALDAIRLCTGTSTLGALAWFWLNSATGAPEAFGPLSELLIGAICSLVVSTAFCILREIPLRLSRRTLHT